MEGGGNGSSKTPRSQQRENTLQYHDAGFRGQVKLLKRLLILNFEELVESIGIDKTYIEDEKEWKSQIEILQSKMSIQYHKCDRAIQIKLLGNWFLYALKYGLYHIRRQEIYDFIKDKLLGRHSDIRNKTILIMISLLILDVRQCLNEDNWLQLQNDTIQESFRLSKVILQEGAPQCALELQSIISCSKLIIAVTLICFMSKSYLSIEALETTIKLLQKLLLLDRISDVERQEFEYLQINMMKKHMKQAFLGKVKGQTQITQNLLQFISKVIEYWKGRLAELKGDNHGNRQNISVVESQKIFPRNQSQDLAKQINSYLLKIQLIEQEIISIKEKASKTYYLKLQKSVSKDMDKQANSLETSKVEEHSFIDIQKLKTQTSRKQSMPDSRRLSAFLKNKLPPSIKESKQINTTIKQQQQQQSEPQQDQGNQSNSSGQGLEIKNNLYFNNDKINDLFKEEKEQSSIYEYHNMPQRNQKQRDDRSINSSQNSSNQNTSNSKLFIDFNEIKLNAAKEGTPKNIPYIQKVDSQNLQESVHSSDQSPFTSLLKEKRNEDMAVQQQDQTKKQQLTQIIQNKLANRRYSLFSQIPHEEQVKSELITIVSLNNENSKDSNQITKNLKPSSPSSSSSSSPSINPQIKRNSVEPQRQITPRNQQIVGNRLIEGQTRIKSRSKEQNQQIKTQISDYFIQQKRKRENRALKTEEDRVRTQTNHTSSDFDINLEILKKSISLAKKKATNALQQQSESNTDAQSIRTRKSTLISTYTNGEGMASPAITYLSSPTQQALKRPTSILEKYHFTYRDKFTAKQLIDVDEKEKNTLQNPLTEYFGASHHNDPSSYELDGKKDSLLLTKRNSPHSSPGFRAIQSARNSPRQRFLKKDETGKNDNKNLAKENKYFIGKNYVQQKKDKILREKQSQFTLLSKRSISPIDFQLFSSMSGSVTPNSNQKQNISTLLSKMSSRQIQLTPKMTQNKEQQNSSIPNNFQFYKSSSLENNNQQSFNNVQQDYCINQTTTDEKADYYSKSSQPANKSSFHQTLKKQNLKIGQNQYHQQQEPKNNLQNIQILESSINQSKFEKTLMLDAESPYPRSPRYLGIRQESNDQERKSFHSPEEQILKDKPKIKNALSEMYYQLKEQEFLSQVNENLFKLPEEKGSVSQRITHNQIRGTDPHLFMKKLSSNFTDQNSFQNSQHRLFKSGLENLYRDNYIVSLKDIESQTEDEYITNEKNDPLITSIQYTLKDSNNSNQRQTESKHSDSNQMLSIPSNSTNSRQLSLRGNQLPSDQSYSQQQSIYFQGSKLSSQTPRMKNSKFQQTLFLKKNQTTKSSGNSRKSPFISQKLIEDRSNQNSALNSPIVSAQKSNLFQLLRKNQNKESNPVSELTSPIVMNKKQSLTQSQRANMEVQLQSKSIEEKINEFREGGEISYFLKNRGSGIQKKIMERIQGQTLVEKIHIQEPPPLIPLLQFPMPQTPSNNSTIGLIQENDISYSSKRDLKLEPEQKFIVSGLLDKMSSDNSSKSDALSNEIKSPLTKDQAAFQSFQDYLNKQKSNIKSQFAVRSKNQFEDSFEKINRINQSILSNQQTPKSQNVALLKTSNMASPKKEVELIKADSKLTEESPRFSKFIKSKVGSNKSNENDTKVSNNPENFSKVVSKYQEQSASREPMYQSVKNFHPKSSFLQVPQNSQQQYRTPSPVNKLEQLLLLRNISRSFKVPLWAEKNQKRFPSFFNLQMNTVQKKLYSIVECFRTIFILKKFFKKAVQRVRVSLAKKKEEAIQNEEQQKLKVIKLKKKKRHQTKHTFQRMNTISLQARNTKNNSIDLSNSIHSLQSYSSMQTQSPTAKQPITQEQLQIMRVFKLKQFKDRIIGVSVGMNQLGEPINKFLGYFPSITFTSYIEGKLVVWKINYEHHLLLSKAPVNTTSMFERKQRGSVDKQLIPEPITELKFTVRIDHQTIKFNFKLNQTVINLLPSNNQNCKTLWPTTFWLFFQSLQSEKNFVLEESELFNCYVRGQTSIHSDQLSPALDQIKNSVTQIGDYIENRSSDNQEIIQRLYETQNNLKFLNYKGSKFKKILQPYDLDYIGKLSYLLQQYGLRNGRIVHKMNGKTIAFQEKTFNEAIINKYKYLLNTIRRYALYYPKQKEIESRLNSPKFENQTDTYLKNISLRQCENQIGLKQSILNLDRSKLLYLQKNEQVFHSYFTYKQKQPHHVLNFMIKKRGAYFLISVNIVFKYDLFQRYILEKKLPFSIYVMAKNMDLKSRVKPIEISQDNFQYFFPEQSIQHEIQKGVLSKAWKLNLMEICNASLEIINNRKNGKQILQNSKYRHYDQELYIKDSILQIINKNSYMKNLSRGESKVSYYTELDDDLLSFSDQQLSSNLNDQKLAQQSEKLFNKNFKDIYEKYFIQKREQEADYNYDGMNIYNIAFQIKNEVEINFEKQNSDSEEDKDEQFKTFQVSKAPNQSLPKEVQFEIDMKYTYTIQRSQSSKVQIINRDYKKLMERLKDFQKQKGQIFFMKNQQRGVKFILQILSERNHSMSHNKLRQKYYINKNNKLSSEKSIDCFIYDYEKKQRYFISFKEKKQIKLLLNILEMNLEGFLMEDLIVKQLQCNLLAELLLLRPCTSRQLKVTPYVKSVNFYSNRDKKLRVDSPVSITYHLLVDSKQIENYYHSINRNYTLNFKELGKCFVSISMLHLKNCDPKSYSQQNYENESKITSPHKLLYKISGNDSFNKDSEEINSPAFKISVLFQMQIMPINSRYKAYKFVLSLADIREIDLLLFKHIQKEQFQESILQRLVRTMSQQLIKVRSTIGSVLAVSSDRVQTMHSVNGKKFFLRLSHFHSYQDSDQIVKGSLKLSNKASQSPDGHDNYVKNQYGNHKSESFSPEDQSRLENRKWRLGIKSLKYSKNKMLKHEYEINDSVQKKRLMEDTIEQRRIIFQRAQKFFEKEFTIITVLKDMLKDIYVIQLYIPKTCRTIQISLNNENLSEVNHEIINRWISSKLIFFNQNPSIPPFTSFHFFEERINAKTKNQMESIFKAEKEEQISKSIFKWQKINNDSQKKYEQQIQEYGVGTPKPSLKKHGLKYSTAVYGSSVSRFPETKRVEFSDNYNFQTMAQEAIDYNARQLYRRSASKRNCFVEQDTLSQISNLKLSLADLIRKHHIPILEKAQQSGYYKPPQMIKVEKLFEFQSITQNMDLAFKKRFEDLKMTHMTKFIEIHIWNNILEDIYFLPNDLQKNIMLMIGDVSFQVQEMLHHENLNIDTKQDIQIEISIDLIQTISNQNEKIILRKGQPNQFLLNVTNVIHFQSQIVYIFFI